MATRRTSLNFCHIELFDLVKKEFNELTHPVSPHTHHLNPIILSDLSRVGYHRCRGIGNGRARNIRPWTILEIFMEDWPRTREKHEIVSFENIARDFKNISVIVST
jgi:hypothetical protein